VPPIEAKNSSGRDGGSQNMMRTQVALVCVLMECSKIAAPWLLQDGNGSNNHKIPRLSSHGNLSVFQ
jgi:hypothetical protein